ncbi:P-loop containing nucleoside triphosphate hydrolase protein [Dichotomocladium elegans]|nr:P-loop containing nucleoside triphosphate hydrolase protein [Dichotomocladium elegans]
MPFLATRFVSCRVGAGLFTHSMLISRITAAAIRATPRPQGSPLQPHFRSFSSPCRNAFATPRITPTAFFVRGLSSTATPSPVRSAALAGPCGTLAVAAVVAGGYKCATCYPTLVFRTAYCEAAVNPPPKPFLIPAVKAKTLQTQQQQQQQKPASLLRDIWHLIKPDLLLMCCILLTAVAAAFVHLQTPIVTGKLINIISSGIKSAGASTLLAEGIKELNAPALKLFGLLAAQAVLTFSHITLVSIFGENVAKRLRMELFRSIVQQDMSFFDTHKSGELVGRLTSDVADFKVVTQGLKAVTQTVGSAVHLFKISTPLTMTICATMPIAYLLLNVYGAYLRKISKYNKQMDGITSGVAGEVISNMRTVRAFAAEEKEVDHYSRACDDLGSTSRMLGLHIGLFQGLTNISVGCMVLMVLYYGGSLVVRNEMTGGDLMSYMLSIQTAQQSLVSLGVLFGQTIKATASATRVFEFIHMYPAVPLTGGLVLDQVRGSVQFRNVEFAYPSRPHHRVLHDFSLDICQGTTIALCGHSGSGKSTIASLLERFYEPLSGTVYVDGYDLSTLDPSWLRQKIGFINQEPILFATSILENIRYGKPDATMDEVREAARQANADMFIESFPDGYDTIVGERGAALSGGQKQRIAIARAILKDPKILILDEATSALDTHSEKIVQDALEKVMRGRTVLIIAHRLSTIRAADMIVVMGRVPGNIIEKDIYITEIQNFIELR